MSNQPGIAKKRFICSVCGRTIEVPFGIPKPPRCPYCGAPQQFIHRVDRGHRWRGGRWSAQEG